MEDEAEKIRQIQTEVDKQMNTFSPPGATSPTAQTFTIEDKMEADARSIYVGNVSYLIPSHLNLVKLITLIINCEFIGSTD